MIEFFASVLNMFLREKKAISQKEEIDMEVWFDLHLSEMNLSKTIRTRYKSIVFHSFLKLWAICNSDEELNAKKFIDKFNEVVNQKDVEVRKILSSDQYKQHQSNFNEFMRIIITRLN
ncbi:hypothetical protein [Aquimarina sp. AD10]|uniref:hypothetical protein n=1 Tax=Aquimarina sp. AD10 TaxID=1714849 RepID=UPI000EA900B7|nr:hypothetical protein [Aquimarina sp. AD10]RKM96828.1 hypothetical protein D7033_15045 [Aquimarina sp. AD10]